MSHSTTRKNVRSLVTGIDIDKLLLTAVRGTTKTGRRRPGPPPPPPPVASNTMITRQISFFSVPHSEKSLFENGRRPLSPPVSSWTTILARHYSVSTTKREQDGTAPSYGLTTPSLWNEQVRSYLEGPQERQPPNLHTAYELLDSLVTLSWQRKSGRILSGARQGGDEEELEELAFAAVGLTEKSKVEQSPSPVVSDDTPLDARLALNLLDSVLLRWQNDDLQQLQAVHGTRPFNHNVLNVILQLWRTSLLAQRQKKIKNTKNIPLFAALPSPKQMITKLDDYRNNPTTARASAMVVVPDVQSYNIILAAAGSLGQLELCRQVYDWMWKEGRGDSLILPDRVTLRTMFQAVLHSNRHKDIGDEIRINNVAAQECERLVHDYLSHFSTIQSRDVVSIYKSLIHIWAVADPKQAQAYLEDMARRHLNHLGDVHGQLSSRHPPPDTMTWNRVISAWSISHGQPTTAMALLDDFWSFSRILKDHKRRERERAAEQSLIFANPGMMSGDSNSSKTIPQPDLFSYNSILEGWARLGNAVEANKVYNDIMDNTEWRGIRPNIVTYTSAIKANLGDLNRVHAIAQDCKQAHNDQQQRREMLLEQQGHGDGEGVEELLTLDRPFFHAWLQACVTAATSRPGDVAAAVTTAEAILLQTMPMVGVQPTHNSFGYLLKCFVHNDDLEKATNWLMTHVKELDERTIVAWTQELMDLADTQLVSFMDRFLLRINQPPKTLLQVLVQENHLQSPEALEKVLSKLSASQGLQVLHWIPVENRVPRLFAWVLRSLAQEGDGTGVEELWDIAQEDWRQKQNRMTENSSPSKMDSSTTMSDIYTSLIVAWSKSANLEKTRHWWNTWMGDTDLVSVAPPTRTAQTAVLSCLAAAFQPNQAQSFWEELYGLHQAGRLPDAPDLVMFNIVLKAWMLAPSGLRAELFLEKAQKEPYGLVPDAISYNSIVQAYVKERKLGQATDYVRAFVQASPDGKKVQASNASKQLVDFPNLATFRSILTGWSLHRQDYALAFKEAMGIWKWMNHLHYQGILKENPEHDRSTQALLAQCENRYRRQSRSASSRPKRTTTTNANVSAANTNES